MMTAAGLAQLIEHLNAEREDANSITGAGPIFKITEK